MRWIRQKLIDRLAYRPSWKRLAVRRFIFNQLDRKGQVSIAISGIIFAIGFCTAAYGYAYAGLRAISTLIGILGICFTIYKLSRGVFSILRQFSQVEAEMKKREITFESVYNKIRLRLKGDETDSFDIETMKSGEIISRSDEVDHYLCGRPTILLEATVEPLRYFRAENDARINEGLAMLLTSRAIASEKAYFFNEKKLALKGNISANSVAVRVARTDYFSTQISNYACTFIGRTRRRQVYYDFTPLFPDENGILVSMARSRLSNQIGVSTLCLDADRHPIVVQQGFKVMSNPGKLAPTGSGSMDWADLIRLKKLRSDVDLISLIETATIRELAEEVGLSAQWISKTQNMVIGFFRYVEHGGLPEFISLSKIGLTYAALRKEKREIEKLTPYRAVRSANEVVAFCEEIDQTKNVSLPLRALCVRLKAILQGDLGEGPRQAVKEFWSLAS